MRQGATKELAQLGRLPVFLSSAVIVAWVSSSPVSGLYLCLYVDSQEGTQQPRALKGTKAEASRHFSGNSSLEQVNIVSTAFHYSK